MFKLGFISFEKVAVGSYQVKSVGQTYDNFLKFTKRANIKPIFSVSSHQTIQELVSTILLIGYKEEISYSRNGAPKSRVIRYDQKASILSDLFNNDIVLASLGNKLLMLDIFLNQYYSDYKKDADYSQIGWALSKVLNWMGSFESFNYPNR